MVEKYDDFDHHETTKGALCYGYVQNNEAATPWCSCAKHLYDRAKVLHLEDEPRYYWDMRTLQATSSGRQARQKRSRCHRRTRQELRRGEVLPKEVEKDDIPVVVFIVVIYLFLYECAGKQRHRPPPPCGGGGGGRSAPHQSIDAPANTHSGGGGGKTGGEEEIADATFTKSRGASPPSSTISMLSGRTSKLIFLRQIGISSGGTAESRA